MSTTENKQYGGSGTWQKCVNCGLHDRDMVMDPPRCPTLARCEAVKAGKPLGGPPMKPSQVTELRGAFELDTKETDSVKAAVLAFQSKEAEEKAEGAILLMAILDEKPTD